MKIIQITNEIGIIPEYKVCKICNDDIEQPFTENLYKINKHNEIINVCKKCYEKNRRM